MQVQDGIDNNIEVKLHIENQSKSIKLIADYEGEKFEVNIESDKIDDGIRSMTDKIYEYILNK
ncbi:hypothetical protein [Chryseobacterium terrae]|uniref:Uncharacterized protein n=1 Tax=Chryseobacterium terrae TaxID=3163299 RepID=A0ABW8Y4V1_9FLAO